MSKPAPSIDGVRCEGGTIAQTRRSLHFDAASRNRGLASVVLEADPRLRAAVVVLREDDQGRGAAERATSSAPGWIELEHHAQEGVLAPLLADRRRQSVSGMDGDGIGQREQPLDQ